MVKLCDGVVDKVSHLEMEAYEALMTGVYLLEQYSFEESLNSLLKAKTLFTALEKEQEVVDSLIFSEKVS